MLFLTVYGPELESLFLYIHNHASKQDGVDQAQLHAMFVPQTSKVSKGQTKNIEDALNYLKSIGLIEGNKTYFSRIESSSTLPFALLLLRQFRHMQQSSSDDIMTDRLYVMLLEQLYTLQDRVWISDVHAAANQLELAQKLGGVSQEKIVAWKRVMEFLGLGYRMGKGFYCLYHPELVLLLARQWEKKRGTLQEFLEEHLQSWIPCLTDRGELARPMAHTLEYLEQQGGVLRLEVKQDSSSRPYFGSRRLRGVSIP
jgi:hypothetical protein